MADRHAEEQTRLNQRFAGEKKLMVDSALNKLDDKYAKMQADLAQRQAKEIAELEVT